MAARSGGPEPTAELILREAARIFAEKGFRATGIAEIETAVWIKRGALYYHIKSKENLLYELSVRHVRESIDAARQILAEETDPVRQLRLLARAQIRRVADRRRETVIWQRESYAVRGDHAARVQALRDESEQLFASILTAGVEQQLFRSDRPIVVKGIFGLLGYTYLWLRPDGAQSPEEVADELIDIALDGVPTARGRRGAAAEQAGPDASAGHPGP